MRRCDERIPRALHFLRGGAIVRDETRWATRVSRGMPIGASSRREAFQEKSTTISIKKSVKQSVAIVLVKSIRNAASRVVLMDH